MLGMTALRKLLDSPAPKPGPLGASRSLVLDAVRRVEAHVLVAVADAALADGIRDAVAAGRHVLSIGCVPSSIRFDGEEAVVEAHLRMEGERVQRTLELTVADGRVAAARQTGSRTIAPVTAL